MYPLEPCLKALPSLSPFTCTQSLLGLSAASDSVESKGQNQGQRARELKKEEGLWADTNWTYFHFFIVKHGQHVQGSSPGSAPGWKAGPAGGQKAAKGQQELQAAQNNGTSAARTAPTQSSAGLGGTGTDTDLSQKRRFSYLRGKQHQGAPLLTHLTQGRDQGAVWNRSCQPREGNSLSTLTGQGLARLWCQGKRMNGTPSQGHGS